jgi:hypothetical protein
LSNTWSDTYSFSWNISNKLLDIFTIELEDKLTSEKYSFNDGSVGFGFEINDDILTRAEDRFVLHFETVPLNQITSIASQNCQDLSQANITLDATQLGVEYSIWQASTHLSSMDGTGGPLVFELDSIQVGANSFRVRSTRTSCAEISDSFVNLTVIENPQVIYDADNNTLMDHIGQSGYWYNGENLITESIEGQIMPNLSSGGTFSIIVSNEDCELKSDPFLITSLEDDLSDNVLSVYPNPSSDFINVNIVDLTLAEPQLSISNIDGKVFFKKKMNNSAMKVDIRNYSAGVYLILIESENQVYQSKFIKQ